MKEFVKTNFAVSEELSLDDTFGMIASCIEQVYSEEESWAAADCTAKEMSQFLEQLSSNNSKKLKSFLKQCQSYLT